MADSCGNFVPPGVFFGRDYFRIYLAANYTDHNILNAQTFTT